MPWTRPLELDPTLPGASADALAGRGIAPPRRPAPGARSSVLAWAVAVYAVAATALLAAGWFLGDVTWWLYAANVSVIYWLAPLVPLLLLALLRRWWPVAAICAVGAAVWLATFGPMLVPRSVAADDTLRVASYNIAPQRDVDHVARMVQREQPDVLLVQELLPAAREDLIRLLPSLPHHHFSQVNQGAPGGGGTAVLSRLPIVGVAGVTDLPATSRPIDIVTLEAGGGSTFDVASLHLASPCSECTEENPTGSLEEALEREAAVRGVEADRLADALPAGTVVLGGDLNSSTFNDPRRRLLDAGLVDVHRQVGTAPGFTRTNWRGRFRIDWLIVSPEVVPVREWVGPDDGSDHRPVIADIALP